AHAVWQAVHAALAAAPDAALDTAVADA
ncbi:MAG: hypothetical protein JWM05_3318, partial [Acidimicrobiales bacterium]|nr:hypothetical protein [Acidimicrobiales bacterium]